MSHEILIKDLRQKSADKIAEIRRKAMNDAAALRNEKEREFQAAKEIFHQQEEELQRSIAESVIQKAEIKALQLEDDALRGCADKLYRLALQQLDKVRQSDYEIIFAELVAELPEVAWEKVRVNPLDVELARQKFPGAEIISDPEMIGGFETASNNEKYRVANNLKRRLEKAWPFVLPTLLRGVREEVDASPAS